jgi:hypothetical protein
MKNFKRFMLIDLIFVLSAGVFFLSCVFTTLQTARTKDPGQAEISAGYMQVRSIEEFSETPIQLVGINARIGVANNFDMGLAHTFDISKDNEGVFKTFWGDAKYQFSNKENENSKLTFSSGLIKGYAYHSDAKVHITSIPLYFSLPANDRLTPTFMYRYGLLGENFFPDSESFDDPRHTFTLGLEYFLKEPDPTKWVPKFAIAVGTIQSFNSESDDSGSFLINFGLKIDSPFGNK